MFISSLLGLPSNRTLYIFFNNTILVLLTNIWIHTLTCQHNTIYIFMEHHLSFAYRYMNPYTHYFVLPSNQLSPLPFSFSLTDTCCSWTKSSYERSGWCQWYLPNEISRFGSFGHDELISVNISELIGCVSCCKKKDKHLSCVHKNGDTSIEMYIFFLTRK